jgi:hypothetical protein
MNATVPFLKKHNSWFSLHVQDLPSCVRISAGQITGSLPPSQIGAGALPSGVTVAPTQLTAGALPSGVSVNVGELTCAAASQPLPSCVRVCARCGDACRVN